MIEMFTGIIARSHSEKRQTISSRMLSSEGKGKYRFDVRSRRRPAISPPVTWQPFQGRHPSHVAH